MCPESAGKSLPCQHAGLVAVLRSVWAVPEAGLELDPSQLQGRSGFPAWASVEAETRAGSEQLAAGTGRPGGRPSVRSLEVYGVTGRLRKGRS